MKQLFVILTLALALSGCIPIIGQILDDEIAARNQARWGQGKWICQKTGPDGECTKWKMKNPLPGNFQSDKKEGFALPGTRALERKLDKAVQDATPWRPQSQWCGAGYLCDDGMSYNMTLVTHEKHASKRCTCTTRAWKKCLPRYTVGTWDHQICMIQHLEFDRKSGKIR